MEQQDVGQLGEQFLLGGRGQSVFGDERVEHGHGTVES
jgi:hypothetical protein